MLEFLILWSLQNTFFWTISLMFVMGNSFINGPPACNEQNLTASKKVVSYFSERLQTCWRFLPVFWLYISKTMKKTDERLHKILTIRNPFKKVVIISEYLATYPFYMSVNFRFFVCKFVLLVSFVYVCFFHHVFPFM